MWMRWLERTGCEWLRWSVRPVSQRTGGMSARSTMMPASGTNARSPGRLSSAARTGLTSLAPKLAPQGQAEAAPDEGDKQHPQGDGVGRASAGARAGIARVDRLHLGTRRAAGVGEDLQVAAAVVLARLHVRVLAELVPRDESHDVGRGLLRRVELAQERLAILAVDDALPADLPCVEARRR